MDDLNKHFTKIKLKVYLYKIKKLSIEFRLAQLVVTEVKLLPVKLPPCNCKHIFENLWHKHKNSCHVTHQGVAMQVEDRINFYFV